MKVLEAVASAGGLVTNEHPKDPGQDPYPSTWALSEMRRIEKKTGMRRVVVPRCLWGPTARKDTCISGTVDDREELDIYGNGRCRHGSHAKLFGKDSQGRFLTRESQSYPPALCSKLAEFYVKTWTRRVDLGEMIDREEFGTIEDPHIDDPDQSLGESSMSRSCPELGSD